MSLELTDIVGIVGLVVGLFSIFIGGFAIWLSRDYKKDADGVNKDT